tara:strand:+ start:138 stop:890 length:753 start_codon:yes stop_codon:yes gene_type:complete
VSFEVESKFIEKIGNWSIYIEDSSACMMVSEKTNPRTKSKDYLLITDLPGQNKYNEVSIVPSFSLREPSNPMLKSKDLSHQLFVSGNRIWTFSPAQDEKVIKSLSKTNQISVDTISSGGTEVSLKFGTEGVSESLKKMKKVCKEEVSGTSQVKNVCNETNQNNNVVKLCESYNGKSLYGYNSVIKNQWKKGEVIGLTYKEKGQSISLLKDPDPSYVARESGYYIIYKEDGSNELRLTPIQMEDPIKHLYK